MTAKPFATAALAAALGLAACATASDQRTVAEFVASSKEHTIFLAAAKEVGIDRAFTSRGPVTVFAPTDAAFRKLGEEAIANLLTDKERLRTLVLAHVVTEKLLLAEQLKALDGRDVNGFRITTADGLKIGGAKVVGPDQRCSNGVVHVIDAVLIPAAK